MSREIKFRAWDKDLAKYLGGCEIDSLMAELSAEDDGRAVIIKQICPARYIFEQYTGLIDKNGKEIYEGDIVNVYTPKGEKYTGVVKYAISWYYVSVNGQYGVGLQDTVGGDTEVIGNIHEKSELLEDENGKN